MAMIALRDLLTTKDYIKLKSLYLDFPGNIGDVKVHWGCKSAGECKPRVPGMVGGNLFPGRFIALKQSFFPRCVNKDKSLGKLCPLTKESVRILLHELVHVEQAMRGTGYRLKQAWWRYTKPYSTRPHEVEARMKADRLANKW